MSTPFSSAIARTTGDERRFSSSSWDSLGWGGPEERGIEDCLEGAGTDVATGAGVAAAVAGCAPFEESSAGGAGGGAAAAWAAIPAAVEVLASSEESSLPAAGAETCSPASARRATTVLIGTVWPSGTRISRRVPAPGEGISASTLSVEISKRGSSRLTASPGFLSPFVSVSSAIDSPICGMMTLVGMVFFSGRLIPHELTRGGKQGVHVWEERLFQGRRVRHRRVRRRDAQDRAVQPLERLLGKRRGDLGAEPARARVLVEDEALAGAPDGREDRLFVEREERAEVEDFRRDTVLREDFGRLEGGPDHRAIRHDREVRPGPADRGLSNRDDVVLLRHAVLHPPVEELVLQKENRVVVADRGLQEALRVVRGRGSHDLEAGRLHEVHLRILRVEGPAVHPASAGPADDHRHADARAVAVLGREVREEVEGARDEVDELHLGDGTHAAHRRADGAAHDRLFGERRVEDALFPEPLLQPFRHLEGAAVDADVLPEDEDARIAFHLLEEGLTDGLEVEDLDAGGAVRRERERGPGSRDAWVGHQRPPMNTPARPRSRMPSSA